MEKEIQKIKDEILKIDNFSDINLYGDKEDDDDYNAFHNSLGKALDLSMGRSRSNDFMSNDFIQSIFEHFFERDKISDKQAYYLAKFIVENKLN